MTAAERARKRLTGATTTTYWACIGRMPAEPPCGAGGVYEQALSGGAAEKHTDTTGHGTSTSLRPIKERP